VSTIVFSVLLALGVNEWRNHNANNARAENARADIVAELEANLEDVNASLQEHGALLEEMREELRALAATPDKEVDYRFNFRISFLQKRAWQSAMITQAVEHMDVSEVQSLADIYELIDTYEQQERRILDTMGNPNFYAESYLADQLRANHFNVVFANQIATLTKQKITEFLEK